MNNWQQNEKCIFRMLFLSFRVPFCLWVWKFSMLLNVASTFLFQGLTQKEKVISQPFQSFFGASPFRLQAADYILSCNIFLFSPYYLKKYLKYLFRIFFPKGQFLINIGRKTRFILFHLPKAEKKILNALPSK